MSAPALPSRIYEPIGGWVTNHVDERRPLVIMRLYAVIFQKIKNCDGGEYSDLSCSGHSDIKVVHATMVYANDNPTSLDTMQTREKYDDWVSRLRDPECNRAALYKEIEDSADDDVKFLSYSKDPILPSSQITSIIMFPEGMFFKQWKENLKSNPTTKELRTDPNSPEAYDTLRHILRFLHRLRITPGAPLSCLDPAVVKSHMQAVLVGQPYQD